jgi:hypothetical protein
VTDRQPYGSPRGRHLTAGYGRLRGLVVVLLAHIDVGPAQGRGTCFGCTSPPDAAPGGPGSRPSTSLHVYPRHPRAGSWYLGQDYLGTPTGCLEPDVCPCSDDAMSPSTSPSPLQQTLLRTHAMQTMSTDPIRIGSGDGDRRETKAEVIKSLKCPEQVVCREEEVRKMATPANPHPQVFTPSSVHLESWWNPLLPRRSIDPAWLSRM